MVQLHFLVRDDDRILPVGRLRLGIARRWCLAGCVVFLEGLPVDAAEADGDESE